MTSHKIGPRVLRQTHDTPSNKIVKPFEHGEIPSDTSRIQS